MAPCLHGAILDFPCWNLERRTSWACLFAGDPRFVLRETTRKTTKKYGGGFPKKRHTNWANRPWSHVVLTGNVLVNCHPFTWLLWEAFYIFAYYGLVVEIQPLNCYYYYFAPLPTSTKVTCHPFTSESPIFPVLAGRSSLRGRHQFAERLEGDVHVPRRWPSFLADRRGAPKRNEGEQP